MNAKVPRLTHRLPLRADTTVTFMDLPRNLTRKEAERIARFIRTLAAKKGRAK